MMMAATSTTRVRVSAFLLCVLGGLSGCTGGSDDAASGKKTTSTPTVSVPSSASAAPLTTSSSNGAAAAGLDDGVAAKVVATRTLSFRDPYSSGTVAVGISALERRAKLMILRVTLTPTLNPGGRRDYATLFGVLSEHSFQPTLIDPVNLKQYRVVTGRGELSSGSLSVSARSGQSMYAWAAFAAPQDNISTIDVQVSDQIPRFSNVPIQ